MLDEFKKEQSAVCKSQEARLLSDTEMDDVSGGVGYDLACEIFKICGNCSLYSAMGFAARGKLLQRICTGYVCNKCTTLTEINKIAKDNGALPLMRQ